MHKTFLIAQRSFRHTNELFKKKYLLLFYESLLEIRNKKIPLTPAILSIIILQDRTSLLESLQILQNYRDIVCALKCINVAIERGWSRIACNFFPVICGSSLQLLVRVKGNRDEFSFVPKKPATFNGQSHFRPTIRENTNDVLSRRSSKATARFHGTEGQGACNCNWNGALPATCGIYIARIFVGELTRLVVVVVGGSRIRQ